MLKEVNRKKQAKSRLGAKEYKYGLNSVISDFFFFFLMGASYQLEQQQQKRSQLLLGL